MAVTLIILALSACLSVVLMLAVVGLLFLGDDLCLSFYGFVLALMQFVIFVKSDRK
jgi:hypothetical protein